MVKFDKHENMHVKFYNNCNLGCQVSNIVYYELKFNSFLLCFPVVSKDY